MKLFHARFDIQAVTPEADGYWLVDAEIADAFAFFTVENIFVGDVIYAQSIHQVTMEQLVGRFIVEEIIEIREPYGATLRLSWGEPDTQYCDPFYGAESVIGQKLPSGASAISTTQNGVSEQFLELSRSIDTYFATGHDTARVLFSGISYTLDLPYAPINQDSLLVIWNGVVLSIGSNEDYTIIGQTVQLHQNIILDTADKLIVIFDY